MVQNSGTSLSSISAQQWWQNLDHAFQNCQLSWWLLAVDKTNDFEIVQIGRAKIDSFTIFSKINAIGLQLLLWVGSTPTLGLRDLKR